MTSNDKWKMSPSVHHESNFIADRSFLRISFFEKDTRRIRIEQFFNDDDNLSDHRIRFGITFFSTRDLDFSRYDTSHSIQRVWWSWTHLRARANIDVRFVMDDTRRRLPSQRYIRRYHFDTAGLWSATWWNGKDTSVVTRI